jgi:UDP-N-acetylmuramyl tripeptide synthase
MGRLAAQLADVSWVTSDNPRSEDPVAIIDQILPGVSQAQGCRYSAEDLKTGFDKKGYAVEPDRRRAIGLAIRASRANDAVLIAGKGHETYQIIGKTVIDFDDREEARRALRTVSGQ